MVVAVVLVVALVAVVVAVFLRSVFGGATFRRERGKKDHDGRPGPRADAHAGSQTWPGGGPMGRFGQWGIGSD